MIPQKLPIMTDTSKTPKQKSLRLATISETEAVRFENETTLLCKAAMRPVSHDESRSSSCAGEAHMYPSYGAGEF